MAIAAVLIWTGCSEEDALNSSRQGLSSISAVIEQNSGNSRVQVNENDEGGATLLWVTDDAFNTFGNITAEYKYNGSVFNVVGDIPQTINYAVYPSSYQPSINGTTLTLNLGNSFNNKEKESKLPMWAGTPVSNQLSFKHLAALLKIDLTGISGYTSIEVTADKAIAGNFIAELNTENPPVLKVSTENTDEANKTVTITLTGNTTDGAEAIYLPIPATTYESLKVTAKGSGVEEKLLKSWTDLTFERAKMYTASIVNLSTPEGVNAVLENLNTTAPVVLNLPSDFTTDGESGSEEEASIIVPNVVGSDLTLSFEAVPTTTEEKPLVIESTDETEVGASTKNLTISIPNSESGDNSGTYLEINTPTTTATVTSGNYATLTATTATNTLVLKSGVTVNTLIINGGNVIIEEGATVTTITNYATDNTISRKVFTAEGLTAALTAGGDVILTCSITADDNVSFNVPSGKEVTLDLCGYTLSGSSSEEKAFSFITNNGTLTINDSSNGEGKISYNFTGTGDSSFGWGTYTISNRGIMEINNGVIENTRIEPKGHMYDAIDNYTGAKLTINGGVVKCENYIAIRLFATDVQTDNEVVINNDAEIIGRFSIWPQNTSNGSKHVKATLDINGGTIDGDLYLDSSDNFTLTADNANFVVKSEDGLISAMKLVKEGCTIQMGTSVELSSSITVPADANITLDLNGQTISQENTQTAGYQMILNDGNLTIKDSQTGGKISYADIGNGGEYISNTITNRGTLTVESGTIENVSPEAMANVGYAYAIDTSIWGEASEVVVNIKGGTISSIYSPLRVRADSDSEKVEANISGGILNGRIDHQMSSSKAGVLGSLNISAGTFNAYGIKTDVLMIFGAGENTDASGITVNITGGTFNAGILVYKGAYVPIGNNFNEKFISGGTFKTDPSAYLAEGKQAVENNGVWTISDIE